MEKSSFMDGVLGENTTKKRKGEPKGGLVGDEGSNGEGNNTKGVGDIVVEGDDIGRGHTRRLGSTRQQALRDANRGEECDVATNASHCVQASDTHGARCRGLGLGGAFRASLGGALCASLGNIDGSRGNALHAGDGGPDSEIRHGSVIVVTRHTGDAEHDGSESSAFGTDQTGVGKGFGSGKVLGCNSRILGPGEQLSSCEE
ncbi:unnamed protein product [Ilex paraguariensis]|uniref:Uncharacterized protein n=1 Tax=Ilex paraguariensis TaxID=185542 RepID=A0ABC8V221_9AQUA